MLFVSDVCESGCRGDDSHGDGVCPLLELLRDKAEETHQEAERHPGPLGQGEPPAGPGGPEGPAARRHHLLRRDGSQASQIN